MISPWAESTDLACSVHDLDEQSCLEEKKAALGKEKLVLSSSARAPSPPRRPQSVLEEALSFTVNGGV